MSESYRILVARLYHESNRLNPEATGEARFLVERGHEILRSPSGVFKGLTGTLAAADAVIEPVFSAGAPPSGLVDHVFYLRLREELLDAVRSMKPDAIGLELHGAMGTTATPDAEGDLLQALRHLVGPDIPIGIGLDLHAHVTGRMLDNTDICIACKENPHSDTVECGQRVAEFLIAQLEGRLNPVTVSAFVPMTLPGAQETASGPLAEIHAKAREYATCNFSIKDISIFNSFRFVDNDEMGQVVTILSDGRDSGTPTLAVDLAKRFWTERDRFKDDFLTVDESFELVQNSPEKRPFVIADMGDRVLAGAPGDSTILLSAALDHYPRTRGALTITDPTAAARAGEAGVGASVTLPVGAGYTPGFRPRTISGRVEHVSDGEFVLDGPFHGGEHSSMGQTAVVLVDERIHVLLTSKPAYSHDPAAYTSQGVALESLDFVVAKSGYHFTLNFAGRATPVLANTPGVGYYSKGQFKYSKSRFWPEHEIPVPEIVARQHSVCASQNPVSKVSA
ncbi:M81 family metallopeptidase [Sinorhizobium medicae]|uniref:M81 family metallopeptidase n=1 Tax=Sinorhizobium medicae TaxID=110321 RepID=UPI000413B894|nr:M81 family metallopeptidase [Sinorhizobium medicae]